MEISGPFSALQNLKYKAGTNGGEWACPCPWCGGRDRFLVWPNHRNGTGGRYMCRKCDHRGDAISFLRELYEMSYIEACENIGIKPSSVSTFKNSQGNHAWSCKVFELPSQAWRIAAKEFIGKLPASSAYAQYRGLSNEVCKRLVIRQNFKTVFQDRHQWGLPHEINPITHKPRKVWLPAGLVMPSWRGKEIVSLKIRQTEWNQGSNKSKYIAIPGGANASYLLPGTCPTMPVVVVESEIDAALIWQSSFDICSVVALGSASRKPDFDVKSILKSAPCILVSLDYDEAGATSSPWWKQNFPQAIRWPSATRKDPGESMKDGFSLRAWVLAGLSSATISEATNVKPLTWE